MKWQTRISPPDQLIGPYSSIELAPAFKYGIKEAHTPLIKAAFTAFNQGPDFRTFFLFIEETIAAIVPKEILAALKTTSSSEAVHSSIQRFNHILPLLTWSESSSKICVSLICPADYTHGVGRYTTDVLCRWLIPGKFLPVLSTQALNFQFHAYPEQNFFFHQVLLDIENHADGDYARNHWSEVANTLKITILAVQHARQIVSNKILTTNQKKALIQENISSLIDRPSKEFDNNIFDQMHHFLIKLSAEEKIGMIRDKFSHFLDQKPNSFDRDIFNEIQQFSMLFRDSFTGIRDLSHISRVISFQYLFRKTLFREVLAAPKERHLSLKFLRTHLHLRSGPKKVLALLIAINVLRENEFFEEKHILSALEHCLKTLRIVPDSFIIDHRSQDRIRLFYLEVEKDNLEPITLEEVRFLKKQLPRELKGHFENVIHPVFMPRNEEEVMRNIVILSQQLKYISDIPQVVISFEAQTEHELSFTVILLRLLKSKSVSLEDLFIQSKTFLKLFDHEVKQVGVVRKKHIKEANVFRILIDKKHFLRKDYSLDLFKARQAISVELCRILGDIRDFNGGILSKQHEVFHKLKEGLSGTGHTNDFLLENFFYSITPPLMQSILSPALLQTLFLMALEALEYNYAKTPRFLKMHHGQEHLIVLVGSRDASFKTRILSHLSELKIPASALTTASVEAYDVSCLGLIYRCDEPSQRDLFENTLRSITH
jgi:hypothetical protein